MSPASTATAATIVPDVSTIATKASTIAYEVVPVAELDTAFADHVDLAVKTRGGKVLVTSDEWFAESHNLLTAAAPISRKGHFTPKGAWFDGWETRRHGPDYDWCVIQLGYPGTIVGFEIDTAFFTGNHSPFVSVEGFVAADSVGVNGAIGSAGSHQQVSGEAPQSAVPESAEGWANANWVPILPKVALNPDSRHGFKLGQATTSFFTHVRFRMFPDGGVARLRVYGKVRQVLPEDKAEIFDLVAAGAGGRVEAFSDAHFGNPSNLLLPGRGHNMSDGWETKRSRAPGHVDWCLIRLATPGHPTLIEIDTAHYMGNPPKSVTLHGFTASDTLQENPIVLLDESPVRPHKQHFFEVPSSISSGPSISTVKVVMIPDGGIKRVRVFGSQSWPAKPLAESSPIGKRQPLPDENTWNLITIQAEPISKEAFEPWGQVIEVPLYDPNAIKVNQGTAQKFSNVGYFANWRSYALNEESISKSGKKSLDKVPSSDEIAPATTNVAIFQCYKPIETREIGVKLLERHPYSSQMFVPMGGDGNGGFVIVVAKDRLSDGKPDLSTLKAFTVKNSQGVNYKPNVWHHPMIVTERPVTFLTITHESGVRKDDCEEYWFKKEAEAAGSEEGIAAVVHI
ncbi:Allantoicase [Mortierella sp. AD011]|nr:Allantoicase [Mortierella sp. AD010]KAF9403496.1 Allantoicase [Mortierella sp. AD011]